MSASQETWRDVIGYEDLYEISSQGQVRSLPRQGTHGRLLRQPRNRNGYRQVSLRKDGKTSTKIVHLLVLEAFVGPRPPGFQARHGAGGQDDNSAANLSWGTPAQNQMDRVRDGTSNRGERSATAKLTEAIVAECRRRYAAGEPQEALAREFGVTSGAMCNAIRGKTWANVPYSVPVTSGKPSQRTNAFRAKMSEKGRRGAAARWHGSDPVQPAE